MSNMATYLREEEQRLTFDLSRPSSLLAIGAHPDDIEFGAGGTIAKWAALGCEVVTLILTDGSKGSWENAVADRTTLIDTRRRESRSALRRLASTAEVRFLEHVDGELPHGPSQIEEVTRIIREVRPEIVIGHDPWKMYRLHPDHRNAGFITTDAVVAARDPLFFPDLPPCFRPRALLLYEAERPNHHESIDGYLDVKGDALLEHHSQLRSSMGVEDASSDAQMREFRRELRDRHVVLGAPFGRGPVEAFHLITPL